MSFVVQLCLSSTAFAPSSTPLESFITSASSYFNVSLSGAFTLSNGKTFAAAGGASNRATGKLATTTSEYPGGSVTKTFTAVVALKLVEAGKLDLDEPVHLKVDPWLKTQGTKSLRELWGGDATIESVTAREVRETARSTAFVLR
eukprot:1816426-Prymnesium_polylepis.2